MLYCTVGVGQCSYGYERPDCIKSDNRAWQHHLTNLTIIKLGYANVAVASCYLHSGLNQSRLLPNLSCYFVSTFRNTTREGTPLIPALPVLTDLYFSSRDMDKLVQGSHVLSAHWQAIMRPWG